MSAPHAKKDAPIKLMTMAEFVEANLDRARDLGIEIDYSFTHDAIMAHDMRKPANIRVGVLYSRSEIMDSLYRFPGNFEKRVNAFLAKS